MTNLELYNHVSMVASRYTTKAYSTSFSAGIALLHKEIQDPIYAIYGFVRFADEIVDTFHDYDKNLLLKEFKKETYDSIQRKISMNPILHSFQSTVNKYNIDLELIETFFKSMEMDLEPQSYARENYNQYIVGSAEVVGLMCLQVFTDGDKIRYEKLKKYAVRLGAAFQKINFLRDLKFDYEQLGRVYFPSVDVKDFNDQVKKDFEKEIAEDFSEAFKGIVQLRPRTQFGVYLAYSYYIALFNKIKRKNSQELLQHRIRVSNFKKLMLLPKVYLKVRFNLLRNNVLYENKYLSLPKRFAPF